MAIKMKKKPGIHGLNLIAILIKPLSFPPLAAGERGERAFADLLRFHQSEKGVVRMDSGLFKIKRIPAIVMLLVLFISIQACTTGNRPSRGSRLSVAMEKASDNNKGSREIEVSDNEKDDDLGVFLPPHEEAVERRSSHGTEGAGTLESQNNITAFGASSGVGLLKSDDFSEMLYLDLSIGLLEQTSWFEMYIGGAWAGVEHTSALDASIDNGVSLFNIGFNYKNKLAENPKWNTPYFLLGAAYKRMYWRYNNEITTTAGDTITGDSLDGLEIHAGLGKNLIKTNGGNIGIEVIPAVIFWSSQTSEGFDNDVFDPFFMLKIQAVFSSW